MSKPFIRNGKLVDNNILKGVNIDKLTSNEQAAASKALMRASDGEKLTVADANALLKARRKGR